MIYLLFGLWYLSGVFSFIFWWTREHDYTYEEFFITAFIGIIGVFAFPIGYMIHGKPLLGRKVLFKKRICK